MSTVLNVVNLEKFYKNKGSITKAVNHIGFEVEEGEYMGIMGASGSGKTTLLNCISTIDQATAGQIYVNGTDVTKMNEKSLARFRREQLGFIFQDFNLLDTLTGRDNIALALAIIGEKPKAIDRKVDDVAAALGIRDIIDKYPYEMSGGQRQRIACARAIVTRPSLILADEPTGALDSKSAGMFLESLGMLNERMKATILMVTHDAYTASHCRRILFLKDGKIFHELMRGSKSRREFLNEILDVLALTGGELSDAR